MVWELLNIKRRRFKKRPKTNKDIIYTVGKMCCFDRPLERHKTFENLPWANKRYFEEQAITNFAPSLKSGITVLFANQDVNIFFNRIKKFKRNPRINGAEKVLYIIFFLEIVLEGKRKWQADDIH